MTTKELRTSRTAVVADVDEPEGALILCPNCGHSAESVFKLIHTTVFECRNARCGLQFANPQLDDLQLGRTYAEIYYPAEESKAAILPNATAFEVTQFLSAIKAQIGPLGGKRVLDYGCGNGALLRIVSQLGADAVGIEQSATARRRIVDSGKTRAYADLSEMREKEPVKEFDYIMMCDAIEHLREPWADLANLREHLSPGGSLFITTPNSGSLRSRVLGVNWDQRNNPTHFYYFDSKSLTGVIRKAGYTRINQLRPITEYRHHGMARRALQRTLAKFGLHGGLLFMASR